MKEQNIIPKKIDISSFLYITIMIIVFMLSVGCNKRDVIPAAKYQKSYSSLEELFNNDFHCYRAKYPDSNTYHFNALVNNEFLTAWNNTPSEFDLNDDQYMNTHDLLLNLTGFGNPQPNHPTFSDFTPYQTFGEGNTWLTYNGTDSDISFGWMHRTPYDETNETTYNGYENIYTWTLDIVGLDNITSYYFVSI
jgi:hypothetical protein|tara:strand:+ start:1573 stop:2151 length:579 start_codon:yes stop_codon:yes gene_type:complete